MIAVFGMSDSGNCYKVKLAAQQLRIPYRWIEVNSAKGETRTPEFLARNPNGKVPTVELEDGSFLAESNAILHYLAHGTPLLPTERTAHARMLQWMFFEQYSHEPYIAVARYICHYLPPDTPRRAELPRLRERGEQALRIMEEHLEAEPFFAARRYTVADIALYAYTHCAPDGGFDLARYPAIRRWLRRVEDEPGFVRMV
ncbi:MAG: glutathione S-transferase family protein [Burkholderiales bacterium]